MDLSRNEKLVGVVVSLPTFAAAGKVPTMVGIFELSAREAARKASYAARAGIDFIQLAPPHYMRPSEQDVLNHLHFVNDAADIGIMADNIPWAMPQPGFGFTARLLEQLRKLECVVGVRWSCHDLWRFARTLRILRDRFNFIDNMLILSPGIQLGAKGFIDRYANAVLRLSLRRSWSGGLL